MAEVDWGVEANEAPKPKKRVPTWAWFCGGGCLVAVLAVGAAIAFFALKARDMMDGEKQSAELQAELAFDELPPGIQVIGTGEVMGFAPGIDDAWSLQMPDGSQLQISKYTPKGAVEIREGIKSGDLGDGAKQTFGPIGFHEFSNGEVDVQGRTLPWLRFQTFENPAAGEVAKPEGEEDEAPRKPASFSEAMQQASKAWKQRMLLMDVTPEGAKGALIVQYQKLGEGPSIEPAEVVEILKPFHIGPNR